MHESSVAPIDHDNDFADDPFFYQPSGQASTPAHASPNHSCASSEVTAVSSPLILHAPVPVTPGMSGSTAWSEALAENGMYPKFVGNAIDDDVR